MKKLDLNSLSVGEVKRIAKNFYGIANAYKLTKQVLVEKIERIRQIAKQIEVDQVAATQVEAHEEVDPAIVLNGVSAAEESTVDADIPEYLVGDTKTDTIRRLLVAGWDRTLIATKVGCKYQMIREIDIKTREDVRTKIRKEIEMYLDATKQ